MYDGEDRLPTEEETFEEAISIIRQMLKTPDQLSRISLIKNKYMRHKQQIDMLLASAVRTQVEETRLGLDLVLRSEQVVQTVRYHATYIDYICSYVKERIPDYPAIQTINIARGNVEMTKRVLQDVYLLEMRASQLRDLLEENDLAVKFVYKELRRLERVRLKAAFQADKLTEATVLQLVEKFTPLNEVGKLLNQRLFENIEDSLILAEESPAVLVRTLQVIEIEDMATNKLFSLNRRNHHPVYREKTDDNGYIDAYSLLIRVGMPLEYPFVHQEIGMSSSNGDMSNQNPSKNPQQQPPNKRKVNKSQEEFDSLRDKVFHIIAESTALLFKPMLMTRDEIDSEERRKEQIRLAQIEKEKDKKRQAKEAKLRAQQQKQLAKQQRIEKKKMLIAKKKMEKRRRLMEKREQKRRERLAEKQRLRQERAIEREHNRQLRGGYAASRRGGYGANRYYDDYSDDDDDDDLQDDYDSEEDDYDSEEDDEDDEDDSYLTDDDDDDDDLDSEYDSEYDSEDGFSTDDGDEDEGDESSGGGYGASAHRTQAKRKGKSTGFLDSSDDSGSDDESFESDVSNRKKSAKPQAKSTRRFTDSTDDESTEDDDTDDHHDNRFGGFGASSGKQQPAKSRGRFDSESSHADDTDHTSDDSDTDGISHGFGVANKSNKSKPKKSAKKNKRRFDSSSGDDESDDDSGSDTESDSREHITPQSHAFSNLEYEPPDELTVLLEKLRDFLEDLEIMRTHLVPCFPPSYRIESFYTRQYLKWFRTVITYNIQDIEVLQKKSLLTLILFTEEVLGTTNAIHISVEESDFFERLIVELMGVYVNATRGTIMYLVDNLLLTQETADVVMDDDDCYITTGIQDLFNILTQQVDINLHVGLKGKALYFIGVLLVEILTHYQQACMEFCQSCVIQQEQPDQKPKYTFGKRKVVRDETFFCAMLNNSVNAVEYTEALCLKICNLIMKEEEKLKYKYQGGKAQQSIEKKLKNATDKTKSFGHGKTDTSISLDSQGSDDDDSDSFSLSFSSNNIDDIFGAYDSEPEDSDSASSDESDNDLQPDSNGKPQAISDTAAFSSKQLTAKLRILFQNCSDQFDTVAMSAIDVCILFSVANIHPQVQKLFGEDWLAGSATPALLTSISRELDNFDSYIYMDAHFSRIVHFFMVAFNLTYIRRFAAVKPTLNDQLLNQLANDKERLMRLFTPYCDQLGQSTISSELSKLDLIPDILSSDPDFVSLFFTKLSESFPDDAAQVLDSILSIRKDVSAAQRKEILADLKENTDIYVFASEGGIDRQNHAKQVDQLVAKARIPVATIQTKNHSWYNFFNLKSALSLSSSPPSSNVAAGGADIVIPTKRQRERDQMSESSSSDDEDERLRLAAAEAAKRKAKQKEDTAQLALDDFLD